MGNLTAILNLEEKLREQRNDLPDGLLDRNIKITYKDNMKLFEESIANILNIHSKKELFELYQSSAFKNDARLILDKYQIFKNRLVNTPYTKYNDKEDVMFINFTSKVASIVIQDIKNRNDFKYNKFILVNEEQFLEHISFQVHSAILKTCYRTLVLDFNVCLEKKRLKGETKEEKYRYYNEYFLGDRSYLNQFFEVYPGILRILHNEVRKFVTITTDIVKHYAEDMEYINFFQSSEPLVCQ